MMFVSNRFCFCFRLARRSSKTSPEEKRNSTEEKKVPKSESDVKSSNEQIPSSEVLIFRPSKSQTMNRRCFSLFCVFDLFFSHSFC